MTLKRQFAWSMAPLIVVTAINIVSVPLLFRYLGAEAYAIWLYVSTFAGVFGFADLGLGVAVGRFIGVALGKGDRGSVREYWGTGNLIAIPLLAAMAVAFVGIGVLLGPRLVNVSPENISRLRLCFAAGGLALFASFYGQIWAMLLQAHLDFAFANALKIATAVVQIVPGIGIAFLTGNPFPVIVWSMALSMIQLGVMIWYVGRHFQLGFELRSARRARALEMASFTGKTFALLLVNSVFGSVDRLLLGKLATPARFDHYSIAANAGARLQGLAASIMGPVFHNTNQALGGGRSSATAAIYDETFHFLFGWYLLASLWLALWHPVILRLWLGAELGAQVGPLFVPVVVAYSLTAIANISSAQLSALNRLGTALAFNITTALLTIAGVSLGWKLGGVQGVAYGFLCSRIALLAQDIFAIRLMKAGGWFSGRIWLGVLAQAGVAAAFGLVSLFVPRTSLWLLLPAVLHGTVVALWLLRHSLRKFLTGKNGTPNPFQPAIAKQP